MMYNTNTMSKESKPTVIKIDEHEYIDLMIDSCARVICFEYETKFCSCKSPSECHGSASFQESAISCIGIINEFGKNVLSYEIDKSKLN
jgi:hypothetical protein